MKYMGYAYPDVLAIHVPNGGARNAREGAKFKKMGVKKGFPDITIFKPKFCQRTDGVHKVLMELIKYCGLVIELKVPPNKVTKEQQEVLHKLSTVGWRTEVCYGFDEFQSVVDEYLGT